MAYNSRADVDSKNMIKGVGVSFLLHIFSWIFCIFILGNSHARSNMEPTVFTVTLEGGEKLGGAAQVPNKGKENDKPPPEVAPEEVAEKKEAEKVKAEEKKEKEAEAKKIKEAEKTKELEKLSFIEEAEKKRKEEVEKKKLEDKQKEEDKKKKKAEDEKKKEDLEKKKLKEELDDKKKEAQKKEQEKKDRDKRLSDLARDIRSKKYEGESVNAGGEGFGAARLGGQGGGGGTLAPYAKVAYQNQLQEHVKAGWRWMSRASRLRTLVRVKISPNGDIADVRVEESSGNSSFDDSVVRAVRKASPVPVPPKEFYNDFADVRFWFDSEDQ